MNVKMSVSQAFEPGLSPLYDRHYSLALNNPGVVPASEATFMGPRDLVVGVVIAGKARAYPWFVNCNYHVINDTIVLAEAEAKLTDGAVIPPPEFRDRSCCDATPENCVQRVFTPGMEQCFLPLLLTFCEACDGTAAFVPTIHGRPLAFAQVRGESGPDKYLAIGTYTICDLETQSRWHPFTGEAMSGSLKGRRLTRVLAFNEYWAEWVNEYPDTLVISGAGELRQRSHASGMWIKEQPSTMAVSEQIDMANHRMHSTLREKILQNPSYEDSRLPSHEIVVGMTSEDGAKHLAYPISQIKAQDGLIQCDFAGEPYILTLASSYRAAVFHRRLDGSILNFKLRLQKPFMMEDDSGTTWNHLGQGLSGKFAGRQLKIASRHYLSKWSEWSQGRSGAELRLK